MKWRRTHWPTDERQEDGCGAPQRSQGRTATQGGNGVAGRPRMREGAAARIYELILERNGASYFLICLPLRHHDAWFEFAIAAERPCAEYQEQATYDDENQRHQKSAQEMGQSIRFALEQSINKAHGK